MEKCNIVYLVSVKCEESNHYSSKCLLFQRCWLMALPVVNTKRQEHVKIWNVNFFNPLRAATSAKNIVLQNIIHLCTCKPTFSYVMHMVRWWKHCGPFMAL